MPAHLLMRRDLSAPIAPAPLPLGVELLPFDRDSGRQARDLLQRVYPEGIGDNGITFDGFWTWLTTDSEYDPTLMFVVATDGQVVGLCHCWSSAFVKDLAVDPAFRRRGLGAALVTLSLEAFAHRGAAAVDLKTEVTNTEAQSLYRRLGFVAVEQIGGS